MSNIFSSFAQISVDMASLYYPISIRIVCKGSAKVAQG
jgi:hypothetical protein